MADADSEAESLQISYKGKRNGNGHGLDLSKLLSGKSGAVDPQIAEAFHRLYDYFKDRERDREDDFRERILNLERELERERAKRRNEAQKQDVIRQADERDKGELAAWVKRVRLYTVLVSSGAFLMAAGVGVDRIARSGQDPANAKLIEQFEERVKFFEEHLNSQSAQMKSFMVAQNDKSGATLKAIDVIKYNQSLTEWYASEDTRKMFKDLHEWLKQQPVSTPAERKEK